MQTKRRHEAYLLIDHRNSPGITPEFVHKNRLDVPAVGAGVTYESAVTVCHGCQGDIILNPNRSRERAWCMKHDAYLCDNCNARRAASGGSCIPLRQTMDELFNKLMKGH